MDKQATKNQTDHSMHFHQGEDIVVVEKGWLCTIHKKLLEQQEG
jgi:hypothetical protein